MTEAEKVHRLRRKVEAIERHEVAIRVLRAGRDQLMAELVNDHGLGVREVARRAGTQAMMVSDAARVARGE